MYLYVYKFKTKLIAGIGRREAEEDPPVERDQLVGRAAARSRRLHQGEVPGQHVRHLQQQGSILRNSISAEKLFVPDKFLPLNLRQFFSKNTA
jgi:hypothetical protein